MCRSIECDVSKCRFNADGICISPEITIINGQCNRLIEVMENIELIYPSDIEE